MDRRRNAGPGQRISPTTCSNTPAGAEPVEQSKPLNARCLIGLLLVAMAPVIAGCSACGSIPLTQEALFAPRTSVTPETFDVPGAELEEVSVEAEDGTTIEGWFLHRDDAEATVLFYGGQGFYLVLAEERLRETLEHLPVNVVAFDYRGYGQTDGSPSVEVLKSDAMRVYDWLIDQRRIAPQNLVIHGHSMGTFMAAHVASKRQPSGVVLESAATHVKGWRKAVLPWLLRAFVRFDVDPALKGEDNVARVEEISEPLLLLVGSEDGITPPSLTDTLYKSSSSDPKWRRIVDGAGHNDLVRHDATFEAWKTLLDHLPATEQTP